MAEVVSMYSLILPGILSHELPLFSLAITKTQSIPNIL